MIALVFLALSVAAAVLVVNALRSPVAPGRPFPPPWLPAMVVSELAPLLVVPVALLAGLGLVLGIGGVRIGLLALWLLALSIVGLVVLTVRTLRVPGDLEAGPSLWTLLRIKERPPGGVETRTDVPYADGLTVDVIGRPGVSGAPALIYLHPGSWMRGEPGRMARPLLHRLAATGWVILDLRYPLSPEATFPDHLLGVRQAIAWAKTGGASYGIDPGRVVVAGGSAGAHLAALAALTWDHPELEATPVDTTVIGCVGFYGIYDLLVRSPTRHDWPFVAEYVMKATPDEVPGRYRLASPIDQVRPDAPPFLLIHGAMDSIVLAAESEQFVSALTTEGVAVDYRAIRGAQHGFDAFASLRTRAVADYCVAWLTELAVGVAEEQRTES